MASGQKNPASSAGASSAPSGSAQLSDSGDLVLLARLLGGRDGRQLAAALLERYGSLARLAEVPASALARVPGLGPGRRSRLEAAACFAERLRQGALSERTSVPDDATAGALARALVGGGGRERFGALFLDTRHRLLAAEVLFLGSIDAAPVYPREIAARALVLGAAAVVLTHNHPSGVAEPSQADRRVTARVHDALSLLDIRLIDHIVVAGDAFISMQARGMVPR